MKVYRNIKCPVCGKETTVMLTPELPEKILYTCESTGGGAIGGCGRDFILKIDFEVKVTMYQILPVEVR